MGLENKRGVFFTIIVIVMISLFLISFTILNSFKDRKTTQDRVSTMNNFVFSIEQDFPRKLQISTFRIIFLLEKDILESGSYIQNLDSSFQEAFYNGTINGKINANIQSVMSGATFSDILTDLNAKAQKINANISITPGSISISQDSPWTIKTTLNANIFIEDLGKVASWNKTYNITSFTSIENLEDPIYILNTNGLISNKITKSPYQNFVSGQDISNLSSHITNSHYLSSQDAPSFLDRLKGQLSANSNGIESIVNLDKLAQQGITIQDKSVVDHIYFSTQNPLSCNVQPAGLPSWFKLDSSHLSIYQVSCV